jgi:hypothetical protein
MKKTLSLLALATTLTSFATFASDSNGGMTHTINRTTNAAMVTIYEGTEVKTQTCIPYSMAYTSMDNEASHQYKIQVQLKQNSYDCNSQTVNEMATDFSGNGGEVRIDINNYNITVQR